jgi:hypothetical protein
MNAENFAEWLARQGHRIIKADSYYWYDAQPGFYFYFPYHRLIKPTDEELKHTLGDKPYIGARFFTPMDCVGKVSYLTVCSDKNYDLTSIGAEQSRHQFGSVVPVVAALPRYWASSARKTKKQTIKSLENFEIRQMNFKELAIIGNGLNHDTLVRQKRNPNTYKEKMWNLYCRSTEGLDGFEAWAAFYQKTLAAFLVGFQMEDHFTIIHQGSATKYLSLYPNNALIFLVTKTKLAQPNVGTVFYGPESLDTPASLDSFKFRMGFTKRAMKQAIIFNPIIKPFINNFTYKSIRLASTLAPTSNTLSKLEGIVRFYKERT